MTPSPIAERSGRFFLAHGLDHAGYGLLAEARRAYAAWGAAAKAGQLDWAYPTLRGHTDQRETLAAPSTSEPGDGPHRRSTLTTGTVDLLGILSASQALSSETSIERLHARVVEVLGAMTGASDVNLLRWNEDRQGWLQPAREVVEESGVTSAGRSPPGPRPRAADACSGESGVGRVVRGRSRRRCRSRCGQGGCALRLAGVYTDPGHVMVYPRRPSRGGTFGDAFTVATPLLAPDGSLIAAISAAIDPPAADRLDDLGEELKKYLLEEERRFHFGPAGSCHRRVVTLSYGYQFLDT